MNVSRYLKRIDYDGSLEPCLTVLSDLQRSHLFAVPFENLDIHIGVQIVLDQERIFRKVVENHRGGFCYELNGLFFELLSALGFQAKRIAAQVYNPESGVYGKPYDHLAIVVDLDGEEYLADVGFGEFARAPLKLEPGMIQEDVSGIFRIIEQEGFLIVQKEVKGEFVPEYKFQNVARAYQEYADMCVYHQTNPNSHFTKKRLISLATTFGRVTITGVRFKMTNGDVIEERQLANETEFRELLNSQFQLDLTSKL